METQSTETTQTPQSNRERIRECADQAKILKELVEANGWFVTLKGRRFLTVQAWQAVAAMNSMVPVVKSLTWDTGAKGNVRATAYAVLYDRRNGREIGGGGIGVCSTSEAAWSGRDDTALAGMAQSRSVSRCVRNSYALVAQLSGFEATPAEEMPREEAPRPEPRPRAGLTADDILRVRETIMSAGYRADDLRGFLRRRGYRDTNDLRQRGTRTDLSAFFTYAQSAGEVARHEPVALAA